MTPLRRRPRRSPPRPSRCPLGARPAARARHGAGRDDFPKGFEGFHTYAEIGAAAKAVADAHPAIARRFSIGKSYQGREIWAMKISDNVATDEAEPEVLFDGGHHADEHMGVEMALQIMHWLVDGYGTTPRITNIVNSREIWIVFLGQSGRRRVRHRRRALPLLAQEPPADARARGYIGTDLNRNYGYRWGGGGRTSTNPAAITYRGPDGLLRPRDPRGPRLPGQPRRRRPAADPRRNHVPRVRPAGDVAVRLHVRPTSRAT